MFKEPTTKPEYLEDTCVQIEKDGDNEQLVVHWMDSQPAPQIILDLLACNCPRKYELPNVNAWLMDSSALLCADYQTLTVKLPQC